MAYIKMVANSKETLRKKALKEAGYNLLQQLDNGLNYILKSNKQSFLLDAELATELFSRTIVSHQITNSLLDEIIQENKKKFSKILLEYIKKYFYRGIHPEAFLIKTYNNLHKQAS